MNEVPYTDRELVHRAITAARAREDRPEAPMWSVAKRAFGVGSTVAAAICVRHGFDPDETAEDNR